VAKMALKACTRDRKSVLVFYKEIVFLPDYRRDAWEHHAA